MSADQFSLTPAAGNVADKTNYLCEDLTRIALDSIGFPRVPSARLFGAVDYKLAAYLFLPEFTLRQALYIDSKAEKQSLNNARVQIRQTSLEVRQLKGGKPITMQGLMPPVATVSGNPYLTTTIFVKYHYAITGSQLQLRQISVVSLPNGFLQDVYNPTIADGIWNVGPDSPSRGEEFRTRVNFEKLGAKAVWRVQRLVPGKDWTYRS